jgi:hypothetical protein
MSTDNNNRSHKVIQYYLDPDLGERAPTDSDGNLLISFGTVLQGQEKRIQLFAHNTIEYDVQLEPLIDADEPDLKITRYPAVLRAGETAEVIVSFKPDLDRIKPLQAGFDFRKIILTRS